MKTELAPVSIPDIPSGVRVASSPEELSLIQQPDCAAAIWQRHPLPTFQRWIDELDPDLLPCARLITRPDRIPNAVREVCDSTGTPDCAERNRLIDDVGALASIFACLMRPPWLRLRFDVVNTNACRKFHVDAVTARLICTYRGTGTEYGTGQNQNDPKRTPCPPAPRSCCAAPSGRNNRLPACCTARPPLKARAKPVYCWCLIRFQIPRTRSDSTAIIQRP